MQKKIFYQYVIPSIGAMIVTALYIVVDGIFIGRGIGENALASVNIALPFITVMIAISMMITMGGATITSNFLGKNDTVGANNAFNSSMKMVIYISLGMSVFSLLFSKNIASILGANNLLVDGTATYIKYYVLFGLFFCTSITLSAFVRNDGNPKLAFWGMIAGAVSNIFLDWLFIFPFNMGIKGAAIASGLGQVIACIILLSHFLSKNRKLHFHKTPLKISLIKEITKTGFPEFITQMSQPITILCYNIIVINYYGPVGVSAYSIVCYIVTIIISIFIGISQGVQPLISYNHGSNNYENEHFYLAQGLKLNIILSITVFLISVFSGRIVISFFTSNTEVIDIAYNIIIIYGLSFIFASINIIYTTYFLAIKKTKKAIVIAIFRSIILNSILIFTLPNIFGNIWLGIIIAEFIVSIISLISKRNSISSSILQHQKSGQYTLVKE